MNTIIRDCVFSGVEKGIEVVQEPSFDRCRFCNAALVSHDTFRDFAVGSLKDQYQYSCGT